MNFSFRPPVAFVAALLLSVTAGFVYPAQGMHNGLLFLVACIVIGLSTFELRYEKGPSAVSLLMPTFITTAVIAVISTLCGFAGSSLGHGPSLDVGAMLMYLAAVVMFGFVSTCISVQKAVSQKEEGGGFLSLLPVLVVYAVVFVLGLVTVTDSEHSVWIIAAYFAVSLAAAFFMMYR